MIDPEHVEEAKSFAKIGDNFTQLVSLQDELFKLSAAGKRDEAETLFRGSLAQLFNEDGALLMTMVDGRAPGGGVTDATEQSRLRCAPHSAVASKRLCGGHRRFAGRVGLRTPT